jgi:hypothetical protein
VSETAPGAGWWLASDGKWYPPSEADRPPAPGWWIAADGKWYPPKEADESPGPGWWLASDGKWYAPEERTGGAGASTESKRSAAPKARSRRPARSKAKSSGTRGSRRRAAKAETAAAPVDEKPNRGTPATSAPPATEPAAEPAPVAARDRARPNANEGVSPLDQIERRNQASRADAQVLAAKRAQAASRALGGMQSLISAELAGRKVDDVFAPPAAPAPAPTAMPGVTEQATVEQATVERAKVAQQNVAQPEVDERESATDGAAEGSPLLEVKSSALSADLEHLGDRLAIFVDRVEMRDRLDRVRQSINSDDIVDVVVQKRLAGAVLIIESARGPGIAAKGLRAEQADEARNLIMTKTRPARMAGGSGAPAVQERSTATKAAKPTTAPQHAPTKPAGPKIDVAGLRSKLADLRRAGLLTEDEYAQKLELLAQLAKGQGLTRSSR